MKKILRQILIFVSFGLILSLAVFAQEQDKNFFWKAESGQAKVYILGSIHLANDDLYPLDSRIEKAFDEADKLVVEINFNNLDQFHAGNKFMQAGLYTDGDSFANHTSREVYELAGERFKKLGSNVNAFSSFKPWFLSVFLLQVELANRGLTAEKGIDLHFLAKARGKKEVLALETVDYQLDIFTGMTDRQQELLLFSTLKDIDTLEEKLNKMLRAYKSGDAKTLEDMIFRCANEYPETKPVFDRLYTKRNIEMAEKIDTYFKTNNIYFVIVGAGHLVGKDGIISLLREKGYKLDQL
ncbi:MAG: TraB/GumN family protein [Candidatus Omnitrophica bacterium]|nr:TraB/GumN family protein [Candidatus Omnitrophota bacterium]